MITVKPFSSLEILHRFWNPFSIVIAFSSSNRSSWRKFGIDPEKAGNSTLYREVESRLRTQIRVPSYRPASVASGNGTSECYMQPKPSNLRYNPRLYEGGLLPRLEHSDESVKLPEYKPRDRWAPHRAHFGENDYIDILGDGTVHPKDFYTGPSWALGAHNEYQRISARLNNPAIVAWMEEFEPSRLKTERKQQKFLFKTVNKRKNIRFLKYRDSP